MTSAAPEAVPEAPTRAARAGALMALSTLAMAGASAIQAVLYLGEYGATARTDAFFAAFAVYQVVGVFTQAMRVSAVPLLVGDRAIGMLRFFGAMAVIAIPLIIACGPLAGSVSGLLFSGDRAAENPEAAALATDALRILGVAMVLQLGAAGAATLLGMRDRFEPIAGAYAGGAFAGLITFLLLRSSGELALAWSMMAMAIVTALWAGIALLRVRRAEVADGTGGPGLAGIERKDHLVLQSISTAGDLLGRSVVYFVINAFFLVTLAIVGAEGGAGETTVLSYAYLLASYLVAGTSTAVGISRAPDMVRGAQEEDWSSVVVDTVPHGYRYAVLVSAPVLAAGAVAASPVVAAFLPDALGSEQTTALARDILLLSPWLAAALLLNFVIPGLFAIGRARTVNLLAPLILALHAGASILAAELAGVEGVVGVMVLAPLVFFLVLGAVGARPRAGAMFSEILVDTLKACLLAAAAFGAGYGAAQLAGLDGLLQAILSLAVGGVLYLGGMVLVAPRVVQVLIGAGRGGATEPQPGD